MNVTFELPHYVTEILNQLEHHGFEAYIVGGSVRDMVMGNTPHDYDITTNALPEEVVAIFSKSYRVIETGIKHGTVTVMCETNPIEITTYRIDGNYIDSRRPESVTFTRSLEEDLARRDFTVNALAYNPYKGLTDYFDGTGDISAKTIKCIGKPADRFREDALRILRALRFSVKLEFDIDKATSDEILNLCNTLGNISAERIQSELFTMFSYGNLQKLSEILSNYKKIVESVVTVDVSDDVYITVCKELERITLENHLPFIYFICKISSKRELLEKNLYNLKVSREFFKRTCAIYELLSELCNITDTTDVKLLMHRYGADYCKDAATITDSLGITTGTVNLIQLILTRKECYSLKQLSVTGLELMNEFSLKGSAVGDMLNKLLLSVITGECDNERSVLISKAKQILNTAET